jgi:soluble lytic murein transglycosylase-like protein
MRYILIALLLISPLLHAEPLSDYIRKNCSKNCVDSAKLLSAVERAHKKTGVNKQTILAIISAESNFNIKAVSSSGARGLMQVIPRWHREKFGKRKDYHDIDLNVLVGAQVYKACVDKHHKSKDVRNKALACYSGYTSHSPVYAKKVNKYYQQLAAVSLHPKVEIKTYEQLIQHYAMLNNHPGEYLD